MKAERVIIVGAGPAGLSAALKLIRSGIRPTLVDEAAESGGQIFRRQPKEFKRSPQVVYGFDAKSAIEEHRKFDEIANKLDSLAKINDAISTNRFQITDPEFHWCFSKLYVLLDNYTEAEKHYIQYNQYLNDNIRTLHSIFLQPINELDGIDLQTDTKLTEIIYNYIEQIKSPSFMPNQDQIKIQGR